MEELDLRLQNLIDLSAAPVTIDAVLGRRTTRRPGHRAAAAVIACLVVVLAAVTTAFVVRAADQTTHPRKHRSASSESTVAYQEKVEQDCLESYRRRGMPVFNAFDGATGATTQISSAQFCKEEAALSVPTERLEAARLTVAYDIYGGHVRRRFFEATENPAGQLVATDVEVPEQEAQTRLADASNPP